MTKTEMINNRINDLRITCKQLRKDRTYRLDEAIGRLERMRNEELSSLVDSQNAITAITEVLHIDIRLYAVQLELFDLRDLLKNINEDEPAERDTMIQG